MVSSVWRRSGGAFSAVLALIAVCMAMCVAAPTQALAKSYEISRVAIDATLDADGTLHVTEDRTFDFDGDFNGVYWRLPQGNYEGRQLEPEAESVGVVSDNGSFEPFVQDYSGDPHSYELTQYSSYVEAKLYNPAEDQQVTYRITYSIPQLATAWKDTGELYWKFVSDGWDETSHNVTCTIHLPVPAGQQVTLEQNVRAWGHGTLDGEVRFSGDDVVYMVPSVGSDDYAEARITFPVEWLSVAPSGESRMSAILEQEQRWADEANRRREMARSIYYGALTLVVAVGAVACVVSLLLYRRYKQKHRPVFEDRYFRDVPSDDHPAVLGALIHDDEVGSPELTATLMRISDEGAVDLSYVQTPKKGAFSRGKETYRLTYNPKRAQKIEDPIDNALLDLLFKTVAPRVKGYEKPADGRIELDFDDIKKVAKKKPERFMDAYKEWKDTAEGQAHLRGFFTDSSNGRGWCVLMIILCGLAAFLGFFAFLIFEAPLPMFLSLLSPVAGIVVSAIVVVHLKALSSEAVELTAKLEALRRWLKEFTRLDEAVPTDVVLWNRLLVMAVVLGVADEVIKQLRMVLPQMLEDPDFMPTYMWWGTYGRMDSPASVFEEASRSSYQASVAALAASSSSSGGGGGGGFSGGGGGGFGGGGGGGAF